jgi:hypothetical protein
MTTNIIDYNQDQPDKPLIDAVGLLDLLGTRDVTLARYGNEAPMPGESADHIDFMPADQHPYDGVTVSYLRIPQTGWGDCLGSIYDRSNYELLVERYRDHLIVVGDDRTGNGLVVPLDRQIPRDLYDSIVYLGDECLLDEEHLSRVESELENECWESMGRHDFTYEIYKLAQVKDDSDEVDELDDPDYVDELFQQLADTDSPDCLEFHTSGATNGYWRDLKAGAALGWEELQRRRSAPGETLS